MDVNSLVSSIHDMKLALWQKLSSELEVNILTGTSGLLFMILCEIDYTLFNDACFLKLYQACSVELKEFLCMCYSIMI